MINKTIHSSIYKAKINIRVRLLCTIAVLTIISLVYLNFSVEKSKISGFDKMVHVANKMKIVYNEIRKFRLNNQSLINEIIDPMKTGFIGEEFSLVTTT